MSQQTGGVRVVIATSGRSCSLQRTLRSLAETSKPPSYLGVLVVENGSRETAESAVKKACEHQSVEYLYYPAANKSLALNHALEQVGDELIYFTDDDAKFSNGVLTSLAAAAAATQGKRYFGGPLAIDYEATPQAGDLHELTPYSRRGWLPNLALGDNVPPGKFLGINWAAFAEDLREIGGFDPMFGPGAPTRATGQESDAQMRLSAAGGRPVFVPGMLVTHYASRDDLSIASLRRRIFRHGVSSGIRKRSALSWLKLTLLPARLVGNTLGAAVRDSAGRRLAAARRSRLYGQAWGLWLGVGLEQRREIYLAECRARCEQVALRERDRTLSDSYAA